MKRFAALYAALDGTTRTGAKTAALAAYFAEAPEPDRLWTIALLSGRRPRRTVAAARLAEWAAQAAGLPQWLFDESYAVTGDLAETISLILPDPSRSTDCSLSGWIAELRRLGALDEAARRLAVLDAWDQLGGTERFLFNKLITGGLRVGVSQGLMTRALAQATGLPQADLAHRLMGDWSPDTTTFARLTAPDAAADLSQPYPFALASVLEDDPATLGDPSLWVAEWKWDGIRGQLIRRGGSHHLWSRGEELITDRFPEFAATRDFLPEGCVLDGEILAFTDAPLPFAALQPRIGRKSVPKRLLVEAPAAFLAYDLLEWQGADLRARTFAERRVLLEALVASLPLSSLVRLSPALAFAGWPELAALRQTARKAAAEGLMLKRAASPYLGGRRRGDWWKWKLDPFTVDAVMVYAQAGHGRRANLYTDYTFAVRDGDALVPFAKAYSGLSDAEFAQITAWVRHNTLDRFGPVRQVKPELVFEIAFEGIQASPRHKSGIALRFPRMARWRRDKPVTEIDTIDTLRALLASAGRAGG